MQTQRYESVVKEQVKVLEESLRRRVKHSDEGSCPTCGGAGLFDLEGKGVSSGAIYFSTATGTWSCMACGLEKYWY